MISNIIKIGKNVDVTPFSESVNPNQEIIEMKIELNDKGDLRLESSERKDANNRKLYHISPTKAINRGKNQHFYPHDFTLSKSFIQEKEGEEGKISGINEEKVERNYMNTRGFHKKLEIEKGFSKFIEDFYEFVLKENSNFIERVFNQNESYFREDVSKTNFNRIVFSFSLSREVIDYYGLEVDLYKSYYHLGEIENFENLFKELVISETLKKADEDLSCSFCDSKKDVFAPSGATIYFSFAKNPENVFYDLNSENADKHLLICKDCYGDYNAGKKFMENNLRNNILGCKYFTVFEIEKESEKMREALNLIKQAETENFYTKKNLKELRRNLSDNNRIFLDLGVVGEENGMGVSMFFYEYDNGYRVLKTIHDIYPSRILDLVRENLGLNNFSFNAFLNEFFSDRSNKTYNLLIKQKLDLLEKILQEIPVNYDSILNRFINMASYMLRNERNSKEFTRRFLKLLELLNKLNIKMYSDEKSKNAFNMRNNSLNMNSVDELTSETGLQKMKEFIERNPFLASSSEIRAGIPLGVVIERLSYEINNYDKRMLGYARKRINDKESLKEYVNEIEEKVVMHEMKGQRIVSDFFEQLPKVFTNEDFSKEDFILGLFTGHSLALKFTND
ncbi:MAG: TM1802 family CRISPR-associated protein [Promethearchaeia archaeon]